MFTQELVENATRMNVASRMVVILLRRQLLQNHLIFSNMEKPEILTWRNTLLRQVKSYIDNSLSPVKGNVIDPTKYNFTQPLFG